MSNKGGFEGYDLAKRILPDSLQTEPDTSLFYIFYFKKFD